MNYNTHTLPNGLRIIHLPNTNSQVVYCGYAIAAGTRHELPGEEGLAHFVEHTTFKGTRHRSAMQILNCLEHVGGDLNAFTTKEHTIYYATVLHENVGRAVDLLTDIVFNSTYPETELEKEKAVIRDEIESYNDTPTELIYDEFENKLFSGHPLGHNILGTRENLQTFTQDDALRFARRHYRPENMVFFVYGDVKFDKIRKRLKVEGGGLKEICSCTSGILPPPSSFNPPPITSTLHKSHHQAHVMIGTRTFAADDPRRMPLFLLNNILGGPGMNARLNVSLRERRALVYTVESSMTTYSDTGMWTVYFGCDHDDVRHCLRLIRTELDRVMNHPLSDRQLAAAKRQLKGQLAIASDNREQFALDMAKLYLHEHKEHHVSTLFQQIDAITSQQILDVAQALFTPEQLQTFIL